tara:strand:- start:333 stop:449 length:117 start_codon:yes stop_codon:yes gene_type:complete
VEKKKESFVQLVMPDMELSLMAQQLKSTSVCFVTDEAQ